MTATVATAPGRAGTAVEAALQRLALQQLHDREDDLAVFAHVVDGQDVGVGERGHRPRLAGEAGPRLGIAWRAARGSS